jgi:hypothetical protein
MRTASAGRSVPQQFLFRGLRKAQIPAAMRRRIPAMNPLCGFWLEFDFFSFT